MKDESGLKCLRPTRALRVVDCVPRTALRHPLLKVVLLPRRLCEPSSSDVRVEPPPLGLQCRHQEIAPKRGVFIGLRVFCRGKIFVRQTIEGWLCMLVLLITAAWGTIRCR
ncbi:hypothetical protein ARMSODRAFT_214350 [Armillaria solidipes]|uniref:Uncharacterized protein n=1 Tax=Armillaria solidipes TaxID=1076256 RepID=A0A2H3BBS9_9AGAR|nr:hypothetical protein ARMSODRAFT_214350 [Armillaria solidipes]